MPGYVGAEHQFHDPDFVRGWAERFVPTPERIALFDLILRTLDAIPAKKPHVVELGIGPGFMARHILSRRPALSYEGVDFSTAMFDVARDVLGPLSRQVTLTQADLTTPDWPEKLVRRPDAIISTWALHDLGSRKAVADVYARSHEALVPGGALINGDFIKPDAIDLDYEPGRYEIDKHIADLKAAGFDQPACLERFETTLIAPTAAQNYACLAGWRR